jgi:hypothetical protein
MPSLELEVEHDGAFFTIDLQGFDLTISEATPGMIVEVERTTLSQGRIVRSDALDPATYDAIERALQAEVRRLQTTPQP